MIVINCFYLIKMSHRYTSTLIILSTKTQKIKFAKNIINIKKFVTKIYKTIKKHFVIPNLFRNLTNLAYLLIFGETLKRVQGDRGYGCNFLHQIGDEARVLLTRVKRQFRVLLSVLTHIQQKHSSLCSFAQLSKKLVLATHLPA